MPLFNAECLENRTSYKHSYNAKLTESYALLESVILNDLEWLSEIFSDVKHHSLSATAELLVCYTVIMLPPRRGGGGGGIKRWSASVCLMSRTSALTRKPKGLGRRNFCTGVPQVTCDSHTDFKVKRSKVKVTGSTSAPQRNVPIFRKRIKLRPSDLART